MARSFHRRSIGYAQADVTAALARLEDAHAAAVDRLQTELAAVRTQADADHERLKAAEASLQEADDQLRQLLVGAADNLGHCWQAMWAVTDAAARTDAELSAEIERRERLLTQLDDVQRRLGSEIAGLTRRYRETTAALRQAVPGQKE